MCVLMLKQVTTLAAAKQIGRLTWSRRTGAATIQLGDHTDVAGAASTHLGRETEEHAIHRGHQATRDEKGRSRIGHNKQHSRKFKETSPQMKHQSHHSTQTPGNKSIAASSKAESAAPSIKAQLSEAIIAASTKTSGAQNAAGTSFATYAASRSVTRSRIQNGHGSYLALAPPNAQTRGSNSVDICRRITDNHTISRQATNRVPS